jgi:F-type H+-transporting ATPase subunit gamma
MATLKDLRTRINSVRQTQKITSAMKMVAASKLRRAQENAEAARPYAERMERMLHSVGASLAGREDVSPMLVGTGADATHLIVVATADRGLCGGFNSSIVRAVRKRVTDLQSSGKTVKLYCVGRKGRDQLRREFGSLIVEHLEGLGREQPLIDDARDVGQKITAMYEAGEFDVCTVVYNKFVNVMVQIVTFQQLIPFGAPSDAGESAAEADEEAIAPPDLGGAIYEFEPEESDILDELLPSNVTVQLLHALLENAASEQGARMSAMDSATRNAGDMIDKLNLTYNRTRQAAITTELIEIISGAEAV